MLVIYVLIVILSLGLFLQATYASLLLLHIWNEPGEPTPPGLPDSQMPPKLRFTLLLAARHEERVIAQTIRHALQLNYPRELFELIVICEEQDRGTIAEAQKAIAELAPGPVRLVTFTDGPINKPHGLNVGLATATGDIVGVFDAEDDVQPDILRVVNTIMEREQVDVVQGPVQLMNHESSWFAALNCVEYYLWFNSRLHHDARAGVMPLGGNTLFVRRSLLLQVGGWDDSCLTEDAELGFRLSTVGSRLWVFSSPMLATREETPPTVGAFVRQRARWHQGYLQVLMKREWLRLPSLKMRLLALHTLTQPFTSSFTALLWPVAAVTMIFVKLPIPITLVAFLPLYALVMNFAVNAAAYWQFTRDFGLKFRAIRIPIIMVAFVPYSLLLAAASARALWREARREHGWDKTEHVGGHRQSTIVEALLD